MASNGRIFQIKGLTAWIGVALVHGNFSFKFRLTICIRLKAVTDFM